MTTEIHINLDPELVRAIDERAGPRGRSAYIRRAVRKQLERTRAWDPDDLWGPERAARNRDRR